MTNTPYIVKMFEYIALDVQEKTGIPVHYEHGHPIEIDNILAAWGQNPVNSAVKYPLIALFQDFDERRGLGAGKMCDVSLELLIATMTEPTLTAPQRMSRTFVPILYPLYNQFLDSIVRSGYFMLKNSSTSNIDHTKTDRLFWGKNKQAAFGDYVDAVHIQNLKLTVKSFNCQ